MGKGLLGQVLDLMHRLLYGEEEEEQETKPCGARGPRVRVYVHVWW